MASAAVFANNEPGIRYGPTNADGQRTMMVRIDDCMNRAVVTPPYTLAVYEDGYTLDPEYITLMICCGITPVIHD